MALKYDRRAKNNSVISRLQCGLITKNDVVNCLCIVRVFLAFYVVEVSSQHTSVIAGNASKRLRFVASQENNYYLSLALRVSLFENKISTLYQGFMKNL